jgi:hypothetical protein
MHNPLPLYLNLKIDNYTTNLECFESFKATIYNKFCENMFMTDPTSRQFRHFFEKKLTVFVRMSRSIGNAMFMFWHVEMEGKHKQIARGSTFLIRETNKYLATSRCFWSLRGSLVKE